MSLVSLVKRERERKASIGDDKGGDGQSPVIFPVLAVWKIYNLRDIPDKRPVRVLALEIERSVSFYCHISL